jgi:hypothetical protein
MMSYKSAATLLEIEFKLQRNDDSNLIDSTLYHQSVGSLIYLTTTQPYIAFAVIVISRFMWNPQVIHWRVAQRTLKYLHGIIGYGLVYKSI